MHNLPVIVRVSWRFCSKGALQDIIFSTTDCAMADRHWRGSSTVAGCGFDRASCGAASWVRSKRGYRCDAFRCRKLAHDSVPT
jgi:hypothetical protein